MRLFNAPLMAAAVPLMVTEAVPLLPIVAPANACAVTLPLFTVTLLVRLALSASATLSALPVPLPNTSAVSSLTACPAGTMLTGAAFTAAIVTLTVALSVTPPALTV